MKEPHYKDEQNWYEKICKKINVVKLDFSVKVPVWGRSEEQQMTGQKLVVVTTAAWGVVSNVVHVVKTTVKSSKLMISN